MVEACGEGECDEAGAEVCFRGGMCVDLDQSWACNCAWGGDFGEDLADVFDGAGALYGFDVVVRGGDEGDGEAQSRGRGACGTKLKTRAGCTCHWVRGCGLLWRRINSRID